jgi:hypothetical protein
VDAGRGALGIRTALVWGRTLLYKIEGDAVSGIEKTLYLLGFKRFRLLAWWVLKWVYMQ